LETVGHLAQTASEQEVDAVLVAGDIFDAQTVSDRTIRQTFENLRHFEGPWVLLPGNHDAALSESVWSRAQRLGIVPENVHLALDPEPVLLESAGLAVLPAPLKRRQEAADLTEWFEGAEVPDGYIRVGLGHGSVTDFLPSEAEQHNPIERTRAESAGLAYLALGDWHGTLQVNDRTWYAGTPETDSFQSQKPGNALLVNLEGSNPKPEVQVLATSQFQWHQLQQSLHSEQDVSVLEDRLAALGEPYERHVVELVVNGVLGLSGVEAVDRTVEKWRGRLRFLRVQDEELWPQATEEDLSEFHDAGFLTKAAHRLQGQAQAEEEAAGLALQMIFAEYRKRKGA
jgi:DNA repair exonuclease SbcCD nuclease subunit